MTAEEITYVEMLLGWELDEWQRAWLEACGDLTPAQARLAILAPQRRR